VTRTVILGAGFGGIAVATELRRLLAPEHEIVLIDRSEHFSMGLRKLWEIAGLGTIEEGTRSRAALAGGIDFRCEEITEILPQQRAVATRGGRIDGEHLVIALGAEPRPDLVAGMEEHAHVPWDRTGVAPLREAVEAFGGGRIAVVVAGAPYKCPPAPYECALLLEEALRERGIDAEVVVTTFQPILLPNAGKAGSDWLAEQLAARGIRADAGRKVARFEPGRVVYDGYELEADLVIGIPPHRVPQVIADSGLASDTGWIDVDHGTLATRHPGVFAIGDVTQIKLANGLPLPKAGIIAERQGLRVAAAIAAELSSGEPPGPFDGHGMCFLEMGSGEAALIEGDFFAEGEPDVHVVAGSAAHAREKREFESERLDAWFGSSSAARTP
jgi:sulfide:quinone oxidoreductase